MTIDESTRYARRMALLADAPIRKLRALRRGPNTISFASALPNPDLFPIAGISAAAAAALEAEASARRVLQYSGSEGLLQLREIISSHFYKARGIDVTADDLIVTTGSQQALDLIGKVFVDAGDPVGIERPGYWGAIQAFRQFEPRLVEVGLGDGGLDTVGLADALSKDAIKLLYGVPNFQNPTGGSYDDKTRRRVAELLDDSSCLFVEDDPYGELRFAEDRPPTLYQLAPDRVLHLGSFSKIVAPGLRLGWICCRGEVKEQLLAAKQATDLQTCTLSQQVLAGYLGANDLDAHVKGLREAYRRRRDLMVEAMERYLPDDVDFKAPAGGMFVWARLARGMSSVDLLPRAAERDVTFVPGAAFYLGNPELETLRLSYATPSEEEIEVGMKRLSEAIGN